MILAEIKKRAEEEISKEVLMHQIKNADQKLVDDFLERFAYEYPYKQEAGRKSKYSVSELKHDSMVEKYDRMEGLVEVPEFLLEEREPYVPEFARELFVKLSKNDDDKNFEEKVSDLKEVDDNILSDNAFLKESYHQKAVQLEKADFVKNLPQKIKISDENTQDVRNMEKSKVGHSTLASGIHYGALRGTAVHRVMECMNFSEFLEIDRSSGQAIRTFISKELQRMQEASLLPDEQLALVRKQALFQFFKSPIALRIAKTDSKGEFFREKAFVMDYEGVLVQGIIDAFWIEDDKIILLDYKTDKVDTADELKARYETQLDLYAQALCRVFSTNGRKIEKAEKLMYSFYLNETIVV